MTAGDSVFIFQPWRKPVRYHDYGGIRDEGTYHSADVTRCGLVMYDTQVRYSAHIAREQADCFAEPCSKCYRGEK